MCMNLGDIKTKKFKNVLKWIGGLDGVEIGKGGNHTVKVHCIHNGNKYPLPASHKTINKHIVKDFGKWLEKNEICLMEDYIKKIK